jgi:predicted ATPase with chaperone activity
MSVIHLYDVISLAITGPNIPSIHLYVSGSAGTGKTFLIRVLPPFSVSRNIPVSHTPVTAGIDEVRLITMLSANRFG